LPQEAASTNDALAEQISRSFRVEAKKPEIKIPKDSALRIYQVHKVSLQEKKPEN
jgi:hypothetical protein